MWIAIGIIGAATLTNFFIVLLALGRMREAEMFLVILSGFIVGQESNAELVAYIKSRSDHPAGKKGVRSVRRMDDKGTA